jgi:hypothetical protein
LYSTTTNQDAIIRLFRVMNRYVGNLPPMRGVFPDYPAPVVRNAGAERELDHDALGNAAAAELRWSARHQQHRISALARLDEPFLAFCFAQTDTHPATIFCDEFDAGILESSDE